MSVSSTEPGRPPARAAILPVATGLALLGAGIWMYADLRDASERLRGEVAALREQLEAQGRVLQLYRFEQVSKAGLGLPALVEQVRFWAPKMALATTHRSQLPEIQERLDQVLEAMASLGPETFSELVRIFHDGERGDDLELRQWLLLAMLRVDPQRGKDFLAATLRGVEFPVSPRLRLFAADRLTALDPRAAGDVLREILTTESHRGLITRRLAPHLLDRYPQAQENIVPYLGFWSFVQKYAATDHPDIENILLTILGRRHEYDLLTLQECVKELGQRGSRGAISSIKDLFENPPSGFHPMFRNHCLDALGAILGSEACQYFQDALRREKRDLVQTKLTDLIKKHCG